VKQRGKAEVSEEFELANMNNLGSLLEVGGTVAAPRVTKYQLQKAPYLDVESVKVQFLELHSSWSHPHAPEPLFKETFGSLDDMKKRWHIPEQTRGYEYKVVAGQGLMFSGDMENDVAIGTKTVWPSIGTKIRASININDVCADHFIALYPARDFHWAYGTFGAIKVAFNCDQLVIYTAASKKAYPGFKPGTEEPKKCRGQGFTSWKSS